MEDVAVSPNLEQGIFALCFQTRSVVLTKTPHRVRMSEESPARVLILVSKESFPVPRPQPFWNLDALQMLECSEQLERRAMKDNRLH